MPFPALPRSPQATPDDLFADLTLDTKDPFHADATSPNAMMLDTPDDLPIDLTNTSDKDDVVLITPDGSDAGVPAPPVASDCRSSRRDAPE